MTANPDLLDVQGVWLTGEDNLRLTTFGSLANVGVAIEGRLVDAAGRVIPFAERHVPNSDYSARSTVHQMREGMLTHVHLRVTAGSPGRGQVFAVLELVRGLTGAVQPIATLLQGYVTTNNRLAWPGSPIEPSVGGAGRLRAIAGTDPAAGAEISEAVPAGVRWRLQALRALLTTSAVAGNRRVSFTFDDGASVYFVAGGAADQVASTAVSYSLAPGFGAATSLASQHVIAAPPFLTIPAGHRIRSSTSGLDVGDNWGAPQLLVEEFIE